MKTYLNLNKKFFICFLSLFFLITNQFIFGQTADLKISNSGNTYSLQSEKERLTASGCSMEQLVNQNESGNGSDWVGDGIFSKFKPGQEVVERRDRTSKHFRNPDGSYTAVLTSGSSLNYQDENGNWKTVCRDIEPTQSTTGYAFKNESNSFKTYFPAVANGNGIKTVLKEGEINDFMNPKMLWLDARGNVINTNSNNTFCAGSTGELSAEKADELIYKNVFSNTDVQFIQTNDGRKQNYILKSNAVIANMPQGAVSIAFSEDIIIPDNWIVVYNKKGNKLDDIYNDNKTIRTISLINQEGNEIFRYLLPVYYDNNGEMIEGSFLAEINNNILTIKTVVPTGWLLSQDRAFPVVIDPDVTVYPTYAADWTGQCNSGGGGGNYNLAVGRASTGTYYRGWNRFNTSSVPDGSSVSNCQYYYNIYSVSGFQTSPTNYINIAACVDPLTCCSYYSDLYNYIGSGTLYVSTGTVNSIGWKNIALGSTACTDFQNNLSFDWFCVGMRPGGTYPSSTNRYVLIRGADNANKAYIVVTYASSNIPPSCTTPVGPTNGATGIGHQGVLQWNASSGATGYDVYFGTSSTPPLVSTNQSALTYDVGACLLPGTTYYWKIVPKNAYGDASGCSTWSFTTDNKLILYRNDWETANTGYFGTSGVSVDGWYANDISGSGGYQNIWTIGNGTYAVSGKSAGLSGLYNGGLGGQYFQYWSDLGIIYRWIYRPYNMTGLRDIELTFRWKCGGENGQDYGNVATSINGGSTWLTDAQGGLNADGKYWNSASTIRTQTLTFPETRNNQSNFVLAFKWNDLSGNGYGTDPSFVVDDIIIKGCPYEGTLSSPSAPGLFEWTPQTANTQTTITVNGSNTCALYEWEQSTDNGQNWSSVVGGSGANTAVYTTPSNLINNTWYRCRVYFGSGCPGAYQENSFKIILPSACSAPALNATANGVITETTLASGTTINFLANESGGSNCSDYYEYSWFDGANYWNGADFSSSVPVFSQSYNNISIQAFQTATFTVTAKCHADANCINTSAVIVNVVSAPSGISAVIGTPANGLAHHLTVSWNTVSGITTYGLEYSTDGLNWTLIGDVSAVTYDFNAGDNPNGPYYFRVRSKLNSVYSAYTSMITPVYTACDYPALPTVDNPTGSTLNIALVPETPTTNPAITTYSIYCETTSQYVQANGTLGVTEVFQTMAGWGTHTISGLSSNTPYCFYAKAKNNDGDVRYQTQVSILTPQAFSSDVINNISTPPTNVWGSPSTCTCGGYFDYNASAGCSGGGGAKFTLTSDNFYLGCFLRSPIVNCTGYSEVTLSFDMTNHLDAGDNINFSCWSVGDNAYRGSLSSVNGVPASGITFNVARNCTHIDAVYNISAAVDKSQLMFYINNNGDQDYGTYNLVIDNFGVNSPTVSACATTTACTAGTWTGIVSTDWDNTGNWSCGIIPTSTTDVFVPAVSNLPVVNNLGSAICHNIFINTGASVTVNSGKDLSVYGNWTNNGVSNVGTGTIIFMGSTTQTINGTTTFGNFTINNSNGVTINSPTEVTGVLMPTSGTLASGGNLTLVSTAAQTALIAGNGSGTVSGNVTMQRYMANRMGYHYYSSPYTAATVSEFADEMGPIISGNPYIGNDTTQTVANFPNFFAYDETMGPYMSLGWTDAGTTLLPMHGYCINFGPSAGTLTTDVSGNVNNGNLSYYVTKTATIKPGADGWNLIGNPYPSPVDWQSGAWTKTYVNDGIYYFKASSQYYGSYSSFVNNIGNPAGTTGIIAAMQGFFVRATGSGDLSVTNAARINDLNPTFYKTLSNTPLLRLQGYPSQNTNYSDETVIYFDLQATGDFDGNFDAYKMMNNDPNLPNIYTSFNGSPALSINGMPPLSNSDVVIPLGFITQTNGNFAINASEILNFDPSLHIYLEDNQMSAIQDLTINPTYAFSMNANAPQYRFFIRFSPSVLTGIVENGSSFVDAWASGKDIYVNYSNSSLQPAEISVYNMLGQTVISGTLEGRGTMRYTVDKPGCYIINVISNNGSYQKKVVIL